MSDALNRDEAKVIARTAAHEAVHELLIRLGVDVSSVEDIRQLQTDLIYIRQQRHAAEQIGANVRRALVGAFVTGLIGLVITGITQYWR